MQGKTMEVVVSIRKSLGQALLFGASLPKSMGVFMSSEGKRSVSSIELERPTWTRHLEFIITCVGMAVGLGNIWRFPHLTYSNGGGAFLVPYFISLFVMGIPLFGLEIWFGQFASLGPIASWSVNPLFKGLGFSMVFVSASIVIYYSVIVSYAVYYLFASMQDPLPWTTCGNEWNTCHCRTIGMPLKLSDPLIWLNAENGLNCTGKEGPIKSSSEEYFYNKVLELTGGIDEPGIIKWDITLCNLACWTLVCIVLIRGVRSMRKVVYFSTLFPYFLMTVLLVRGITLKGAMKGINYYLSPDPSKLLDSTVWKSAASQIFYSLSCCMGSLPAMSSYNKFTNNFLKDSITIPVINCLTSFYAGFAIFSVLGYMADNYDKDVKNVTTSGPGLVFVAYPEGLGTMPAPQLWSILFFAMMVSLGMGTLFPTVETVMTSFQDEFPLLRRKYNSIIFRASLCVLAFLLGLPQTTQGGLYLLDLNDAAMTLPLLMVGLFEILAIGWLYGPARFTEDVMLMIGHSKLSRQIYYGYFRWSVLIMAPTFLTAIVIYSIVKFEPLNEAHYPFWANIIYWLIVIFIVMWIPMWYVISYCTGGGAQLLYILSQPTIEWGPAEVEYRTLPRYQLLLNQDGQGGEQSVYSGRSGSILKQPSLAGESVEPTQSTLEYGSYIR